VLNGERIGYWLSVGAQPSEKVKVLIKKYGSEGTHREQQRAALDRLAQQRRAPQPSAAAEQPEQPEAALQTDEQTPEETPAAETAEEPQAEPSQE
jgi:small subunit ribosomal protein S16